MNLHDLMFVVKFRSNRVFAKLDFLLYTNIITSIYKPLIFKKWNFFAPGEYAVVVTSNHTIEDLKQKPWIFDDILTKEDFIPIASFRTEIKYIDSEIENLVIKQMRIYNDESHIALYKYYAEAVRIGHTEELSWEELSQKV